MWVIGKSRVQVISPSLILRHCRGYSGYHSKVATIVEVQKVRVLEVTHHFFELRKGNTIQKPGSGEEQIESISEKQN